MNMKESYVDAMGWLSQHPRNGILIKVKSDSELKKYQKYFNDKVMNDLFADEEILNRIEWRIDSTVS